MRINGAKEPIIYASLTALSRKNVRVKDNGVILQEKMRTSIS